MATKKRRYGEDGGPAFPLDETNTDNGMSLRDWFAGQALASMQATNFTSCTHMAKDAYCIADEMLAVRDGRDT